MQECIFFITPFGDLTSETRKNAEKVREYIIAPALQRSNRRGLQCRHADELGVARSNREQMFHYLERSPICIADVSQPNCNVYFEVGYRHALKLPLILLAAEGTVLQHNVNDITVLKYRFDNVEQSNACQRKIVEVVNGLFPAVVMPGTNLDPFDLSYIRTQSFADFKSKLSFPLPESIVVDGNTSVPDLSFPDSFRVSKADQ